jgi:hypothetical protein
MGPVVRKLKWREKRGEGFSTTVYEGLYFPNQDLLTSGLSHGLRPISIRVLKDAEIILDEPVSVPEDVDLDRFIKETLRARDADLRYQRKKPTYDRLFNGK